jgi:hypothetical protein
MRWGVEGVEGKRHPKSYLAIFANSSVGIEFRCHSLLLVASVDSKRAITGVGTPAAASPASRQLSSRSQEGVVVMSSAGILAELSGVS